MLASLTSKFLNFEKLAHFIGNIHVSVCVYLDDAVATPSPFTFSKLERLGWCLKLKTECHTSTLVGLSVIEFTLPL